MVYLELPNDAQLWRKGIVLDWYTKSYDKESLQYTQTELGQAVRDYKYYPQLSQKRRDAIVKKCSEAIVDVLQLHEQHQKPTFNSCIGVPPNRKTGHSLPLDLAHQLSIKFEWLNDDSNFLTKTRELDSIKQIGGEKQRAEYLKGAYSTKESSEPAEIYGFLVIDDVFETGSTLREICRTLEGSFPGIPRYVLTVTQKKPTVIWKMGQ